MISVYYRVKAGESLSQIARRYGVEEEVLVRLNRLEGVRFLEEGQQLRIPVKEPVRHRPPKPAPNWTTSALPPTTRALPKPASATACST